MLSASLQRMKVDPMRFPFQSLLQNDQSLIGCSLAAHIKVPDAKELLRKQSEFGGHLSMVYGDYTREIHELADMMGLDVVYAT